MQTKVYIYSPETVTSVEFDKEYPTKDLIRAEMLKAFEETENAVIYEDSYNRDSGYFKVSIKSRERKILKSIETKDAKEAPMFNDVS